MNEKALSEARTIAGYKPSARQRQSSGLVGEVAARDFVQREYRGQAKEIDVMRRGGKTPVIDLLFETGKGEFVVVEAKANQSPLGKTNRRVFRSDRRGRLKIGKLRKDVEQFSPVWFEQRLAELRRDFGPEGRRLANRLEHAWQNGKLRAILVRAPDAGRTAEHVVIEDVSKEWNMHLGVESRHTLPSYNVEREPTRSPATLAGERPTNVERGIEAVERAVPAAEPHFVPRPRVATAEHLGVRALEATRHGFRARTLAIGIKSWRVARSVGKILVACFVPLTVFDVVLEVALAFWDRQREKEARKRREKQQALEAVFREDKKSGVIQRGIQRNIVGNADVQARLLASWDENKNYNGFQYARLNAVVRVDTYRDIRGEDSESLTTYSLEALDVHATSAMHDFELTAIGEDQEIDKSDADVAALFEKGIMYPQVLRKIVKRKRLKYTIVPPLITPYDIAVTKINNLFLDLIYFVCQFSNVGDSILASFRGFDYAHRWDEQFTVAIELPPPLNRSVCEYCLSYLHWAAKQLSQHPLAQQDLEGNLEDPTKGWRRRLWLLLSLLDGTDTRYRKNFSYFASQLKRMVENSERTGEVAAAIEQLYTGARSILYDLERIEANLHRPEYYYLGPQYRPPE